MLGACVNIMFETLFYFMLALLLLVIVHEFGHFIVARWCGVKVLRFSFGFGKVLFSKRDRRGTEYAFSAIPLGGYVSMLDETVAEVPAHERHLAFNRQPLLKRVAIVLAGPLFNFLFAFFALWLVLVIGIQTLAPLIDTVIPGSIADNAGLTAKQEMLALDDKPVGSWREVQFVLMNRLGSTGTLSMRVQPFGGGKDKTVQLSLAHWTLNPKKPDLLGSFGIVPFVPKIPAVVGDVLPDSPAALAGLRTGDLITVVNGRPLKDWMQLVALVREHPDETMTLSVMRQGISKTVIVRIARDTHTGQHVGVLGVRSQPMDWPTHWWRWQRETPWRAMQLAFRETVDLTGATFAFIGRLCSGKLSLRTLSGPVGIAEGAGESARQGLTHYLTFLALVSISLGVLNMLPIPMLDGGYLLYYLAEFVGRRPLSAVLKTTGTYLGFMLLIALMIVAFCNDLARLA